MTPTQDPRTERPLRVLHLIGIGDRGEVRVEVLRAAPRHSTLAYEGNLAIAPILDRSPDIEVERVVCGAMPGEKLVIAEVDLVVNAVADGDGNAAVLAVVCNVVDQLGLPVVNHPANVEHLRADRLPSLLAGIAGLVVPHARRLHPRRRAELAALVEAPAEGGAGGPAPAFIVRPSGRHGDGSVLVRSAQDVEQLDRFAFDGRPYDVIDWVDFRSPDGLYRCFSALVVGDEVIPVGLRYEADWPVGGDDRRAPARLTADHDAEARSFRASRSVGREQALRAVASRLGIEVAWVEYGLAPDGDLVLLSVNDATIGGAVIDDEVVLSRAGQAFAALARSLVADAAPQR